MNVSEARELFARTRTPEPRRRKKKATMKTPGAFGDRFSVRRSGGPVLHGLHGFRPETSLEEAAPYAKYLKKREAKRPVPRTTPRANRPAPDDAIDLATLLRGLSFLQDLLGDNGTSLLNGLLTLPDEGRDSTARVPGKIVPAVPARSGELGNGHSFDLRNFKTDENLALLRDLFQVPPPPAQKPAGRGNRSRR